MFANINRYIRNNDLDCFGLLWIAMMDSWDVALTVDRLWEMTRSAVYWNLFNLKVIGITGALILLRVKARRARLV